MRLLPEEFLGRMRAQLGGAYADYLSAMEAPPQRALRVNTLKTTPEAFAAAADFPLLETSVSPVCFLVPEGFTPGRHILHRAGHFYMQEPSAQLPAAALPITPGAAVLDLCAAPGGKASQLAARLCGTGLLVANEPVPGRARTLQENLERLGVTNAAVTCAKPELLAEALPGAFSAVLVDAPCSGEGMFRKDEEAVRDWSGAHVRACAQRQALILDSAAKALAPGGALVYSTCTFSPEENEQTVESFLKRHGGFSCALMRRIYPQDGIGEGQFYAVLQSVGEGGAPSFLPSADSVPAFDSFLHEYLPALPPQQARLLPDGRVFLQPERLFPGLFRLHLLSCGVLAGEVRNGRFTPAHALAMAYGTAFAQRVSLDGASLSAYLRGETVPCAPSLSGWCAVSCGNAVLGLGKAVSGTLKNHLPKGLRG